MAGYYLLVFILYAEEVAHTLRHVAVTRAVEAVAAHAVLLVQVVRNGVKVRVGGHRLVERSVENTYLRQAGHQLADGLHALEVGRVVQRCEVDALLEGLEYLVVDYHALVKLLASVHHSVPYGVDFVKAFDYSDFGVGEQGEDELHALGVLRDVVHYLFLGAVGHLHLDERPLEADALGAARCHDRLVVHVVKCVLDGRAAAVQDKYFHCSYSIF